MTLDRALRAGVLAALLALAVPTLSGAAGPTAPAVRDTVAASGQAVPENEPVEVVEAPAEAPFAGPEADPALLSQPAVEDIQLQMNADVVRWVQFFTGAGRSTFERWMKRSGRYMDLFRNVLQREGLPPDLVHLVFVESGFNLEARSYASAVGPWQFLRGTAQMFGLNVNQWHDERKDPEKSTVAAARYLRHLHGIFNDWPLALSAYNAGEGTILRAIKSQGTTNYWDLRLPRQTEEYVPKFMAALAISRDPVKYGFNDIEFESPLEFDEIALTSAVDLRQIAKLADCDVTELKRLNPAVVGTTARPVNGVVTLRVPEGKSEYIQQQLAGGTPLPAVNLTVRHRVRRNETLNGIAAEYSVSANELARINKISRKRPLRRGMMLTVPATLRAPAPKVLDPALDPRTSTAYVPARNIRPPAVIQGSSDAEGRTTYYVKRGETIQSIAEAHGVTAEDVRRWNPTMGAKVRAGQLLQIREGDAASAVVASEDSAQIAEMKPPKPAKSTVSSSRRAKASATHTVRRGETMEQIARRHGVTVKQLMKANGMRSSHVQAGKRLKLPA